MRHALHQIKAELNPRLLDADKLSIETKSTEWSVTGEYISYYDVRQHGQRIIAVYRPSSSCWLAELGRLRFDVDPKLLASESETTLALNQTYARNVTILEDLITRQVRPYLDPVTRASMLRSVE